LIQVTAKEKESAESLLRRFNKKVIQSGVLGEARRKRYFEKPISKTEARSVAIRKARRKEQKAREILGIK
jgi:small subunit ribosomal protein S21